jgi:hypothetical protein
MAWWAFSLEGWDLQFGRYNFVVEASRALQPDVEASIPEEPGARKPHAGIRAGAIGYW